MSTANATTSAGWRFSLASASTAFVLWGCWAYWVNRADSPEGGGMAYISGLTQGLGSFVITLIMVRFVTALYSHVPRSTQLVLPALLTVAATGTCLASIHALVGTRDIVRTIAPALSVAFVFNVFTAAKLRRLDTPFAQAVRHGRTDP